MELEPMTSAIHTHHSTQLGHEATLIGCRLILEGATSTGFQLKTHS